jgi:hypothetical protein
VPAELCAIVDRCMEPSPADRYPDAGALADDLARFLDGRLVLAHACSAPELLLRWLRRHRVAVGVAGLALLVVVGVSAVAAVRTVDERDAARAAQHVAVAAQARSDASLADALVLAARTAAARGAWAEAEVLAARALSLAESPEARGVLAASAGRPRPVRTPAPALQCEGARGPGPDGRSLCQEEGRVRLDRDGRTAWQIDVDVQDAAFAGTDVVVSVPGPALQVRDGETGALRHTLESFNTRPLTSGTRAAWLHTGTRLGRIDAASGTLQELRPCGDHTVGAVGEGPDGWVLLACAGGGLVDLHVESGTLRPRAFTGDDQAAPIALLSAGPAGRVAVASNRGAVNVSDRDQERWAIDLDAASGARLARLPAAAGSFVEGREGSSIWSPGRGGESWDLGALRPGGLGGGAGLSAAIFGTADDVFRSRGDGSVARYDRATGTPLGAATLTNRVIKGVAPAPGAPGVVALGAGGGTWWLSPDLSERRHLGTGGGRRIAALRDHVVVLHYGTRTSRVPLDPDRETVVLESDGAHAYDLRAAPDGSHAVMVDDNGVIARLDAAWGAAPEPVAQVQHVSGVHTAPDGGVVWVEPGAVVLHRDDAEVLRAPLADVPTLDCAVSDDGALVAVGGLDGRVRVLDLEDGRLRAVLEGHTERVATVAWDPARRLISASWDGTARIWGLEALDRSPDALLAEAQAGWGITASDAVAAGAP